MEDRVLDSGFGLAAVNRMLGQPLFDSQYSAASALSLAKCLQVALVCDGCVWGRGVEVLR